VSGNAMLEFLLDDCCCFEELADGGVGVGNDGPAGEILFLLFYKAYPYGKSAAKFIPQEYLFRAIWGLRWKVMHELHW
jgi:hypothetical protein